MAPTIPKLEILSRLTDDVWVIFKMNGGCGLAGRAPVRRYDERVRAVLPCGEGNLHVTLTQNRHPSRSHRFVDAAIHLQGAASDRFLRVDNQCGRDWHYHAATGPNVLADHEPLPRSAGAELREALAVAVEKYLHHFPATGESDFARPALTELVERLVFTSPEPGLIHFPVTFLVYPGAHFEGQFYGPPNAVAAFRKRYAPRAFLVRRATGPT